MMQNYKRYKMAYRAKLVSFLLLSPVSPLTSFLWFPPKTFHSNASISVCISVTVEKHSHKHSLTFLSLRDEVYAPSPWVWISFGLLQPLQFGGIVLLSIWKVLKGQTASTLLAWTLSLGALSCNVQLFYNHHAGETTFKNTGHHFQLSHTLATKAKAPDSSVMKPSWFITCDSWEGLYNLKSLVKTWY